MKLLILDLDETLIHSVEAPLARDPDFTFERYHVYKRPGVDDFIRHAGSLFELAVWSASTADYASAVVAQLFPPSVSLSFVWARDRCTRRFNPARYSHWWIKDLKKVKKRGYDLKSVLMVDDTAAGLTRQYGNLVRVTSFEGDTADNELYLLRAYLSSLAEVEDVRQVEKRGWHATVVRSTVP
jgi:RNA polymerase II subunit A small phosphatase-like protein